jgi:monoamine oxidase
VGDEVPGSTELSRRSFAALGAAAAGSVLLPRAAAPAALADRHGPSVVVVGAGLAGLACADVLHRNGVRVRVYEARADRVGGRCWSARGWRDGQVGEHGGEFIDTRHTQMRRLARRFGLRLDDTWETYEESGGRRRTWLKGHSRLRQDFAAELDVMERRLRRLSRQIGSFHYQHPTAQARAVDEMTARQLLDEVLPGGSDSVAGHWVHSFMAGYLGLDLARLSGIALVDNMVGHTPGADERYHVSGGNDQVVHGLMEALPRSTVTMDAALQSARVRRNGRVALRLGHRSRPVECDRVVFAMPFTTLREVDLDGCGLSGRKMRCIAELGMGTNAKVILQLAERPQAYGRWNGLLDSDRPYFGTWESSAGQGGTAGLVTAYFGGRSGDEGLPRRIAHGRAPDGLADDVLRWISRGGRTDLPGLRRGYLGRAWVDHWSEDRWARGSYAAFLPGQYTRYAGFVGRPEGPVHFAGEHTSPLTNQGYLEGAVRSGRRAAAEILRAVR